MFRPIGKFFYWCFIFNFCLLTWLGSKPVEDPYVLIAQLSAIFFFSYFLIIIPLTGLIENKLLFSHGQLYNSLSIFNES